jgi:hypothetical protein
MSRNTGVEKRLNFSYQENIFVLCFTIEQVGFKRKENEWIFTYHKNCFKKKGGGANIVNAIVCKVSWYLKFLTKFITGETSFK